MVYYQAVVINFADLQYEILDSGCSSESLGHVSVKVITRKSTKKKCLKIKYSGNASARIVFKNRFFIGELESEFSKTSDTAAYCICRKSVAVQGSQSPNTIVPGDHHRAFFPSTYSDCDIPFYFSLVPGYQIKDLFRSVGRMLSSTGKNYYVTYNYDDADFFLLMFDSKDNQIGAIAVKPNGNMLLTGEFLAEGGTDPKNICYVRFSVVLRKPCCFCLGLLSFSYADSMSTHIWDSQSFGVTLRLRVCNLKKKNNGVVIFFPSRYTGEKAATGFVKWPYYTRLTWANDLRGYCTIFVSDPFQFVHGNTESSWFVSEDGRSILPEIAQYIRKEILNTDVDKCGPIINYGSSMGGFSAFLFSCFLRPDLCFCECPQSNLLKNRFSNEYLSKHLKVDVKSLASSVNGSDLGFGSIFRKYSPGFRTVIHFYSMDGGHISVFNDEIKILTSAERRKFNYKLIIENDIENQLFSHQAMPKKKVLHTIREYLKPVK